MDGICTLGNDKVYHQIIALLNSIEAIYGQEMPVCIYPYDDNITKITAAIAHRANVQIYSDRNSIQKWDNFARNVWDTHPTAKEHWQELGIDKKYLRFGTHRRYCAFDGPFDRFVYMDADTLLMSSLEAVFAQLNQYDWVVYDFQYKDLSHVYSTNYVKLQELFPAEKLNTEIFCSGFYGAKKDLFNEQQRQWLIDKLAQGEAEVLYDMAPDQTILNYMVMRLGIPSYNFANHLPNNQRTGCCATSPHFESRNHVLYDRGNRLTYLHYIGLSSKLFNRVCDVENIDFPYREIFLHYRYLHEPEKQPKFTGKPKLYNAPPNLGARVLRKLKL